MSLNWVAALLPVPLTCSCTLRYVWGKVTLPHLRFIRLSFEICHVWGKFPQDLTKAHISNQYIYIPILLPVCLSVLLLAVSTLPWLTQPIPDVVFRSSLASLQYCWRHSQLETAHEWRGYCTWLRKNPPSTDNQLGPSFRSRNIYLNSHVAEKYCGAPQSLKIKYQTLVK